MRQVAVDQYLEPANIFNKQQPKARIHVSVERRPP
jgi:hypothetical protein